MKKTLLLLFFLFPIVRTFGQQIQGTIKMGSHSKEVYLTIRNNSASPIVGNITKLNFVVSMFLENFYANFRFDDFSILPKPGTGNFTQSSSFHMFSNYALGYWTGSKPISLLPGEELNIASFGLSGTPYILLSVEPILYLNYSNGYFAPVREWLIELDGVAVTTGKNRFYDNGSATYISNENEYGGVNLPAFGLSSLPVKLASFDGSSERNTINLTWTTTEESNSSHFEVENSLDAKAWKSIGKVQSVGQSATLQRYSLVHLRPASGKNYYRLKMVDEDATFAYSKIVSVDVNGISEGSIYPNPVGDRLMFLGSDLTDVTKIRIFNASGKMVSESTKVSEAGIDVRNLPAGLFVVKMEKLNGATVNYKMLKK